MAHIKQGVARHAAALPREAGGPTHHNVPPAATVPAPTPTIPAASPPLSVLVVDDDKSARSAMAAILTRLSFAVSEAGSVAEAVDKLADAPDWVLLDLMLPDGSGCGVIKSLRDRGISSRVCVITGAAPALIEQARVLRPNHVLRKPLDLGRLLSILAT